MEEVIPALGAGVISTIICNPLDTIRVNYQLNNSIQFKVKYLYRGISYGIIAIPSFWTIYFPLYKKIKEINCPKPVASYISCCAASTFTTPFWVLRQRLQTDKTTENMNFYKYYRGLLPTYIINLSFTIQIPLYEYLKDRSNNSTFNTFLNTSISKTVSACVFYPIDTIRAKLRNADSIKNMRFLDYYKGISMYLLRSIPYHATVFCSFEFIKNLM